MASPDTNQQPSWPAYEPTKDCSQGFCSIYCPQWCYIAFPPPPPFSIDEPDSSTSSAGPTFSPLVIAIIGILASAFLLVTYYVAVSKYCGGSFCRPRRRRPHPVPPSPDDDVEAQDDDDAANPHHQVWHLPPSVGLDEALISRITVCRYKRGDGLVGSTDCSVCLGEFCDDERLRLLPKCSHAFHVQCIDTWLRSHSNCPLCRAKIVVAINPAPVPTPPPGTGDVEIGELDEGTSNLGNDDDAAIEIRDEDQRMKRSVSLGSLYGGRVSIADILQADWEEELDPEILVGSWRYVTSPAPVKRSMSSGRFCLTRQGRGRNLLLPI